MKGWRRRRKFHSLRHHTTTACVPGAPAAAPSSTFPSPPPPSQGRWPCPRHVTASRAPRARTFNRDATPAVAEAPPKPSPLSFRRARWGRARQLTVGFCRRSEPLLLRDRRLRRCDSPDGLCEAVAASLSALLLARCCAPPSVDRGSQWPALELEAILLRLRRRAR